MTESVCWIFARRIDRIEKYTVDGREVFENDELIQVWVLRHLQIIGEACRSLTMEFKHRHPDVPWSEIVGMRNILVHDYFGIDVDVVWSTVETDIPNLKKRTSEILAAEFAD
jgi:uncharacterized protein with HEPN domain